MRKIVYLYIASGLSLLLVLPRILIHFNVWEEQFTSFTAPTVIDIIFRFIFWTAIYFGILYLNAKINSSRIKSNFLFVATVVSINFFTFLIVCVVFPNVYTFFTHQHILLKEKTIGNTVFFIVIWVLVAVSLFLRYRGLHTQALVERSELKQKELETELATLKNQLDPHFLFNCLNTLSQLTINDKKSSEFINQLATLYRNLLSNKHKTLITIKDELAYLHSYIYLMRTRYQDNLTIKIDIKQRILVDEIPVQALLVLVENAVKHNEISKEYPLEIELYNDDENIIVKNKIRLRHGDVHRMGNGLDNLNKRYKIILKQPIKISNKDGFFMVKIPLISNENSNSRR